ncbi:hypothetical protein L228DRAFT_269161 [Xylona heveae TC161]|uniref:NUDE domain-containing protein n=1 Tax=Xylona heveae (strain CBS 132557 / TC161) TaxID=1328760 RepID=A0A165G3Q1_XYLHT|nr:hypothetical protein L228DRAFT_269161 [Xylona heveae TC161]KZF21704.1 hypothetical protein L228DRAFT_269161 [Xylona heveae TC161]
MTLDKEPPSSPAPAFSSTDQALSYYKSQYEQLEAELSEFQTSSRELEAELEKDIEASEKRERQLREKVESLGYEAEEWKAKYKQSKSEGNAAQNALQKEITSLRDTNRTIQLRLRDIEVANDDFERQARNTTSSLEDLESKYNMAIERGVLLEEEVKTGEQERESLRIETQRLRDELSDLRIEAEITQEKLRHSEAAIERQRLQKIPILPVAPRSPTSEASPRSSASLSIATPPAGESSSSTVSGTPSPPSPVSEASVNVGTQSGKIDKNEGSIGEHAKPRSMHPVPAKGRSSIGRLGPTSGSTYTPSTARQLRSARMHDLEPVGLPHSSSLHQIRGLIGKMQKLEQRVHSVRSKLPAPANTPPRGSPRSNSALGHNYVPSTVTVRSNKKRLGGSNASTISPLRDFTEPSPLSTRRVSRFSATAGSAAASEPGSISSRPSSRASLSARGSVSQLGRPPSRTSLTGARTPLGYYSHGAMNDGRRPRSSVSGSYAGFHGHGHSMSVSSIDERDDLSTPTPRRLVGVKPEPGSGIPTPSGLPRRQSGGGPGYGASGIPMTPGARRASSSLGHRTTDVHSQHGTRLSGVGETY